MMKKFSRLSIVLPMLLALLWQAPSFAEASIGLKSPTIQLRDIALGSINFDSANIIVELAVDNPNDVDMVVETILYGLTLNQTHIKYGRIQQQERFPANSERSVKIPVSLAYDEHLPDILSALSRTTSSTYKISGSVQLQDEAKPLFFHHSGSLLLPSSLAQSVKTQSVQPPPVIP